MTSAGSPPLALSPSSLPRASALAHLLCFAGAFAALSAGSSARAALGVLENPADGSYASGVGLVSGWVCDASSVSVVVDGSHVLEASYGTARGDTAAVCGDTDNGFGVLLNMNLLGDGTHVARAYADGSLFGMATFEVTTLGVPFLRGASGRYRLPDFPEVGQSVTVRWLQESQNFIIDEYEGGASMTVEPGYYRGGTSQGSVCSSTAHPSADCEIAFYVGSTAPGIFHLEPDSIVDMSTNPQCDGSGVGDFASLQIVTRCAEGQLKTFTACNFHAFSGSAFSVEFTSGVAASGLCGGFECSGTLSASPPSTGCTFSEISWSANLILF